MPMYLDITSIPGESASSNANWNNKIEVQYFSYGIAVDHSMEVGTGVVASGAQCGHFNITKVMDKSTPLLFAQLCSGQTIKDVYLRVTQNGPSGAYESEQYHMQWVVVSHYSDVRRARQRQPSTGELATGLHHHDRDLPGRERRGSAAGHHERHGFRAGRPDTVTPLCRLRGNYSTPVN